MFSIEKDMDKMPFLAKRKALEYTLYLTRRKMKNSINIKGSIIEINAYVLVRLSILSAISVVLSYFEITPPLSPYFVKLDISDFPALLASFAFSPFAGVIVEFVKNLLRFFSSVTCGIGELANFIIGASMAFSAGIVYKRNKTKKGALISLIVSSFSMALTGSFTNYFILLPLFSNFMPIDTIIASFNSFIPFIKTKMDIILFSVFPFNLVKGILISIITYLVYKRLGPILNGRTVL